MKQKILYILLMILAAFATSEEVWAWGETTSYVLEKEINGENSGASQYNEDSWQLSGPGAKITLDARKYTAITAGGIDVQVSKDGSNWTTVYTCSSLLTGWKSYEYQTIDPAVTHIRLKGNLAGTRYYRNVRVTRATTLSTSTTSLSFGNVTKGSSKTLNASIDYNNTTYNQQVTGSSTNGKFSVTATTVGATGTGQAIPVVFKPTAVGAQSGTVTLNMNGKNVSFSVSGTGVTTYYTQAQAMASTGGTAYASWTNGSFSSATTSTKNSGTVSTTKASATAYYNAVAASGYVFKGWTWPTDSYTAGYVSTNATDQYTYDYTSESSSSPTIAAFKAWFAPQFHFSATATSSNNSYGTATAAVSATVEGNPEEKSKSTTATFTATHAEGCTFNGWYDNSSYSGTPVSTDATYTVILTNSTPGSTVGKTLYAKFKKNPALQWTVADLDLNIIKGTSANSAAEGADQGMTISYKSSNTNALTIDTDGTVHAVGLGTSVVTASVAEDNNYNADAISRTFTVGEKQQAAFTPAWGESLETNIKVGASTTIALTNVATDATFTITNGDATILSVERDGNTLTIRGLKAGETTLQLNQAGSATLDGANTTYTITVSRYANTFALDEETKAMQVGEVWNGVVTNIGNDNTQVSYSVDNVATYDATNNRITAVGEGSTVITFTQEATADHEGTTKTINVSVTKVNNTLSISLPIQAADVDGTIALSITNRNNTETAITAEITDTELSSAVNNGTDVITFANGVITARNAGTAKIKFSQAATTKYTGYESDTYTITVSKRSNSITITNLGGGTATNIKLKYNATAALAYTSTNTDTSPVVTRTSGSYTTYSNGTITAGTTAGTDIYEITQAETYKYEAGYAQFSIRVNNTDEAIGYVLYENAKHDWGTWGEWESPTLTGPADVLTYQAYKNGYGYFFVMASKDNGANYSDIDNPDLTNDDYKTYTNQLDEDVNRVKFETRVGATLHKWMNNIFVTRKTYVRASANKTNLGTLYTDQTASATFTVKYSSTNGGNINIQSNNPNFVPSVSYLPVESNKTATAHNNVTYICGVDGTQTFTVTYTPDPDNLGEESAVITIGDLFYSKQITLTATSRKYDTSIARGSNTATETTVDGTIANAFAFSGTSTATPSASSDDDFYYVISHTQTSSVNNGNAVISYDPATNTITGLNAGTARLTIYQKKTLKYHATSKSFDFTVTKLTNNVGIALSATELDVDGTATVQLTNNDSNGALSAAYSNVSYTNESQNREGGLLAFAEGTLTGVNAGTATVTITQAETYKYVSKSATFDVGVSKLSQTLSWDDPDLETTMQVGATVTNTATSDAGLAVTYISGNTAAITIDANTGVLTAVATGSNIAITASQAGNYKYLPATLTRQFSVFNKQTPTFVADDHFTGTEGRIEYLDAATITVSGVSAGEDFTITYSDEYEDPSEPVLSVVRSGESNEIITLTGLRVGSATLTLSQQGNEDFIAKTQTYNIEVYWPDDYLALSPTTAPTNIEGEYRKVFLSRTLKAGYSTIALPFTTTVEAIVGEGYNADVDWVAQLDAVTLNYADSYTLYFRKDEEGVIWANQPYVLHLGAAVVNPSWSNVIVEEASETPVQAKTGYSGYTDWSLCSNFEPGMDMEGKYGIVNTVGGLKLGGSGSTLNAFAAYITAPAGGGNVKARSAFVDADGKVTAVEGLPFDNGAFNGNFDDDEASPQPGMPESHGGSMVYGLDGRRRQAMGKGINIVRTAFGTVRKVLK